MEQNIIIPDVYQIISDITQDIAGTPGLSDLDTDPSAPTGQQINVLSNDYYQLYLLLMAIYTATKANMAQGQTLRDLLALINVYDPGGTKTVIPNVTLTGINTTVIPAGSLAATSSGNQFYTASDVTISGTTAVVDFYAVNPGAIAVGVGDLNTVVTNISGWTGVNNSVAGTTGTNSLQDFQLRQLQQNLINQFSMGYVGAIKSRIFQNDSVIDINLIQNDTNADLGPPTNVPANSFLAVIYYIDESQEQKIANSYFNAKPAGAVFSNTDGTEVTKTVTDSGGHTHTITWNKATPVPIYIDITATSTSEVSANAQDQIKAALVQYVSGNRTQSNPGIAKIASTIYYTRILGIVANLVQNLNIETFYIGTSPTPTGEVDLTAAFKEILTLETSNINVVVT